MPEGEDDALREAAAHRGLKLVKSRRRKEGVGDYGRYGLTDASGKELLGFGSAGLTGTPADIRDYLRKSEVSTWARSAEVTPDRPTPMKAEPDVEDANVPAAEADEPATAVADNVEERFRKTPKGKTGDPPRRKNRAPRRGGRRKRPLTAADREGGAEPATASLQSPELAPAPEPAVEHKPEPLFEIRSATEADVKAISRLVDPATDPVMLRRRFKELRRAAGGVLVADRGRVVGCLAWQAILNLHQPPIGRVTLLLVEADERRRGTGTALVASAAAAMVEQGCDTVEALSDIEVRNVNGFYRATGFRQQSYRFVRNAGL